MAERLILEEAIEHAKQIAKEKRKMSEEFWDYNDIHGVNKKQKAKCISCAEEHEQLAIWLAELKRYKDLEEQHILIELPCAVGDTVWFIGRKCVTCDEDDCYGCPHNRNGERTNEKFLYITTIKQFEITKNAVYMIDTDTVWSSTENSFNIDEIGRTVFLTKEEAEEKLKELRGEQE